jgi:hypothetical protein
MNRVLAVALIVAALLAGFAGGVCVQHRVTIQCARAAEKYAGVLDDVARSGSRFDALTAMQQTVDARAAEVRCKAGGL